MPKNTNKRTEVKDMPRPRQELTANAAKKVKGGRRAQAVSSNIQPATTNIEQQKEASPDKP